jgi:hypothetical protein
MRGDHWRCYAKICLDPLRLDPNLNIFLPDWCGWRSDFKRWVDDYAGT